MGGHREGEYERDKDGNADTRDGYPPTRPPPSCNTRPPRRLFFSPFSPFSLPSFPFISSFVTKQMSNVDKKVNMQASSQNLLQALEATNLALPLGVLVAQRQTSLLFKEDLTHLKLVSNLYDEVRSRWVRSSN